MGKLKEIEFHNWEQLIRSGQGKKLRQEIINVHEDNFSRNDTAKLANFARRVGLPHISLKLLRKVVRSEQGINHKATDEEKSEYAAALIREGVVGEGLKILSEVNSKNYPESLLYSAFGLFTRWDYFTAEPLLQNYVKLIEEEYKKILGNINLVAALIFINKLSEAEPLLKQLLVLTQKEEFKLSHSYCLELNGQFYIQKKEYSKARDFFKKASALSANSATSMPFLSRKWLAITDLLEASESVINKNTDEALTRLDSIKTEAKQLKDFETVRTCDLHLAICKKDERLAAQVYYGTPHFKFRQNVAEQVEHFAKIPAIYEQHFSNSNDKSDPRSKIHCFDMLEGREISRDIQLKPNQAMHRVFQIIASDFYKPVRATEIFSLAFPNEYFDQNVSINRVHQVVKRLREWLYDTGVPIKIIESDKTYQIQETAPYIIRWSDKRQLTDKNIHVNKLFSKFEFQPFKLKEAASFIEMPDRSISRIINKAVQEGVIEQLSSGPGTKYCFVKK